MQAPAVEFVDVTRRFGAQIAADGVSFTVEAGESFALIGVNGAGKTTLLRCLLDYCRPDSGSIRIAGVPATEAQARRALAWLPERFAPPYYLTGRDYLRMHHALRASRYDEAAACAQLEALDFDPGALDRAARNYSKGMNQKLGLAACLLAARPVTVLDEPMSGLDPRARAAVRAALQALRDAGRTLLFSSHALEDVAVLADRLAVIDRGRVAFIGTAADLVARAAGGPAGADHGGSGPGAFALEAAFLHCITGADA
jgi:ABC-2 type transport system ATP-binding protein